jgi:hypothetical protein
MPTLTVATTACIKTIIICATGVTPAKRCEFVKLSRKGKAKESAKATTATNNNILSGLRVVAPNTACATRARIAPAKAPLAIGRAVNGGKSIGTEASRSPTDATSIQMANVKSPVNEVISIVRNQISFWT